MEEYKNTIFAKVDKEIAELSALRDYELSKDEYDAANSIEVQIENLKKYRKQVEDLNPSLWC